MQQLFNGCVRIIAAFCFLVILSFISIALAIVWHSKDPAQGKADAAIVLGAAVWKDTPSPVFRERIRHAIELYRAGRVKFIIFTGGYGEGDLLSEAAAAKNYALAADIPGGVIVLEEKSHTTFQNLFYGKEAAKEKNIQRYFIVSDPLHLRRAMLMAGDLNIKAEAAPTPTTLYTGMWEQLKFLIQETYYVIFYWRSRLMHDPLTQPAYF